ncbi:39S ribosomal protein L22, mitochondrial [Coemansia sp. RSA 1933]|nr:39S ribosomal protein L22, mitochondrial [Coemansia sp. RSA 1933]
MLKLARAFHGLTVTGSSLSKLGSIRSQVLLTRAFTTTSAPNSENQNTSDAGSKQVSAFDELESHISKESGFKRVDAGKGKGTIRIREYRYSTTNFHVSPRKLRLLANQITGQPITEAIRQMEYSPKKAATKIMHSLVWARKNAVFQKQMNPDNMFLKLVRVGKGQMKGKRVDYKARGRHGVIRPPRAHLKYIVWEKQPLEQPVARNVVEQALLTGVRGRRDVKGFKLTNKVWMPLRERQSVINAKPFYNW